MSALKSAIVLTLVMFFAAVQSRGAAAVLPPDVIAADTVAVIRADAAHFSPDKLQAAMTAILGDEAKEVDEPLAKFKDMFTKATGAGVDAITMVVGAPKKDDPDERRGTGILYITLKPDADVKAVEALVTEKMLERGDKREIVFDQVDNFLAMHTKKQEFPVKPDADRTAIFTEALQSTADASLQVAFIPDQAGRDMMIKSAQNSDPKKDIRPKLATARWMSLGITLGSSPQITASANLTNDADAKSIADVLKFDFDDIKTEVTKPGPMLLFAPTIQKVIDGLKITQPDTHVSLSINADSLKLLAEFAANMGMFGGR